MTDVYERKARKASSTSPVLWQRSPGLVDYQAAVNAMAAHAAAIAAGSEPERIWLLEHAEVYTAGTSARDGDLLDARFPVIPTGRGGQYTYHGPGQRVGYVMLDLARRGKDVRAFVWMLERWLIDSLAELGVRGETREGRIGVWVRHRRDGADVESKIAALGIRVSRWVTYHGVSLNVSPELSHFSGIVPCGVRDHGVTSLADIGVEASMPSVDEALRTHFERLFGTTTSV